MVLSRSRHPGLLLLASFVLFAASTSASDELSAQPEVHAQASDKDSKTDVTLASTQYHPVYESDEPERQPYHHSDNSEYYSSRSKHDDSHEDPNNQYYTPRGLEQQHHDRSEQYHSSEQYNNRQYNSRPSYEQYESHDSYYKQGQQAYGPSKQNQESYGPSYTQVPAYEGRKIEQVCLQAYGKPTKVNGSSLTVSQDFICCSGPATDDSCLRNSTYGYSNPDAYDTYKREDSPSFMDAMLTPQIAAVCTFAPVLPLRCPEWAQQWVGPNLSPGCVGGVTVKCALTKFASQCGCPAHAQGLEFESHAYVSLLDGVSCGYDCLQDDLECRGKVADGNHTPVMAGGPYEGIAELVQGGFSEVFARGEQVDIAGSVEYTSSFYAAGDIPPVRLLPEAITAQDLPIFKSGQMKVRLAFD